jgi:hypothetical protein
MASVTHESPEAAADRIDPGLIHDAHRDVLLAVQRGLAANWDREVPRIAVVEREGITTAYVSTAATLGPVARADIRGAVRAALAPYTTLAPYTNVVFLTRGHP